MAFRVSGNRHQLSSVAQSCPNSLWPHGLQHTRPPCPSPTPGASSNSCPSSQWWHPTHPIFCRPLPPSILPSIRVFSNESVLNIRWPKYWSFSFSISHSNEYSGLISFRTDWLDLLTVQGTLKSLLQHHSSKASVLRHSAFLIVQLSYPYMTTGKTIALTRWTFVGKVMSLLFNMLAYVYWYNMQACHIAKRGWFLLLHIKLNSQRVVKIKNTSKWLLYQNKT